MKVEDPKIIKDVCNSCYEVEGVLPVDHTIKIAVWDWDMTTSDDLIGETSIDLENRIFTNHRANCGLAAHYYPYTPIILYLQNNFDKKIVDQVIALGVIATHLRTF